jgi:hypothetical protein
MDTGTIFQVKKRGRSREIEKMNEGNLKSCRTAVRTGPSYVTGRPRFRFRLGSSGIAS